MSGFAPDTLIIPGSPGKMLDGLRTFCENYVNFVGAGSISLASGCAERSLIPPPLLSPRKRKGVFAGSHFGRLHIPRVRLRPTLAHSAAPPLPAKTKGRFCGVPFWQAPYPSRPAAPNAPPQNENPPAHAGGPSFFEKREREEIVWFCT